jgi:hypothetical protein
MGGEGDEVVGLKKEGAERKLVLLMHDVFEIGFNYYYAFHMVRDQLEESLQTKMVSGKGRNHWSESCALMSYDCCSPCKLVFVNSLYHFPVTANPHHGGDSGEASLRIPWWETPCLRHASPGRLTTPLSNDQVCPDTD